MLFADGRRLGFELFQFLARGFERRLAFGTEALLLFHRRPVALPLLDGFFGIPPQPFELYARDGEARIGAAEVFAELAHVVIERQPVLLPSLLQPPQPLQLRFERDGLLLQAFEPCQHLIERGLAPLQLHTELARFALHGQRARARFLSPGYGVPW